MNEDSQPNAPEPRTPTPDTLSGDTQHPHPDTFPKRIGVLGAGQLGRMLALSGLPLGLQFRFFDPTPDSPAGEIAEHIVAPYDDRDALARFAADCDVITYEFENVPVETAEFLMQFAPVYPPPDALRAAQDRLTEKRRSAESGHSHAALRRRRQPCGTQRHGATLRSACRAENAGAWDMMAKGKSS